MFAIDTTVDFFDYQIDKLTSFGLPESLMQVHDITHHLGKKRNRMAHSILQQEVKIVSTIIVVFGDCMSSHVVHLVLAKELHLRHGFCHYSGHLPHAAS
jgi:hypothetical protein